MEKHFYKTLVEYDFQQPAALCSLVDYKGSVPRKDFPQILVRADGKTFGTVGGGHLEHSVIQSAKQTLTNTSAQLLHFEMTGTQADSSDGICGGTCTILVEVFTSSIQDQYRKLDWNSAAPLARAVFTHYDYENAVVNRIWEWDLPNGTFSSAMLKNTGMGELRLPEHNGRWFRQVISPPTILHIFGAGHVGQSVAELAHFLDLDVMVYDDRPEVASQERFPYARELRVDTFENLVENFSPATGDYVLVMTKGHRHDYLLMQRLLKMDLRYLGLMASKRKWTVLRKALQADGFTEDSLNRAHAPLGLDIGSETVPEIAVSIMAEVIHDLRLGKRSAIALAQAVN